MKNNPPNVQDEKCLKLSEKIDNNQINNLAVSSSINFINNLSDKNLLKKFLLKMTDFYKYFCYICIICTLLFQILSFFNYGIFSFFMLPITVMFLGTIFSSITSSSIAKFFNSLSLYVMFITIYIFNRYVNQQHLETVFKNSANILSDISSYKVFVIYSITILDFTLFFKSNKIQTIYLNSPSHKNLSFIKYLFVLFLFLFLIFMGYNDILSEVQAPFHQSILIFGVGIMSGVILVWSTFIIFMTLCKLASFFNKFYK